MTAEEVLKESSDKQKILDYAYDVEELFPYKLPGDPDTYCDYNQGWSDACDRIISYIENL